MINSYNFGEINIDGKIYTSDVIILPGGIKSDWWRRAGHELSTDDIREVLDARPDVLVVGTGASGMMRVLPEVNEALSEAGIELIEENTERACEIFNGLPADRKAAAALHLTC